MDQKTQKKLLGIYAISTITISVIIIVLIFIFPSQFGIDLNSVDMEMIMITVSLIFCFLNAIIIFGGYWLYEKIFKKEEKWNGRAE